MGRQQLELGRHCNESLQSLLLVCRSRQRGKCHERGQASGADFEICRLDCAGHVMWFVHAYQRGILVGCADRGDQREW